MEASSSSIAIQGKVQFHNGRAFIELGAVGDVRGPGLRRAAPDPAPEPAAAVGLAEPLRPPVPNEVVSQIASGEIVVADSRRGLKPADVSTYVNGLQKNLGLKVGVHTGGWSAVAQMRFLIWLRTDKRARRGAVTAPLLALPPPAADAEDRVPSKKGGSVEGGLVVLGCFLVCFGVVLAFFWCFLLGFFFNMDEKMGRKLRFRNRNAVFGPVVWSMS